MAKTELSVIDFAMKAEKEGIAFYTRAAKKFNDKELKEVFMTLAKEEAKHLESFIGIKAKAENKGTDQCFRSDNVSDYLSMILREGLFPRGDSMTKRLEKVNTVYDACVIAMDAEKIAVMLYSELAKLSKDKDQKKLLENIAKEERSHFVMVGSIRADHDPAYGAWKFGRFL